MKGGMSLRLSPSMIVLFIIIGAPALVQLALWLWQPMFYNELVMHDGLPFLHWWPESPYCDSQGNLAKADFHRNLLVVFLTANSEVDSSQFSFPRSVPDGAAFFSQWRKDDKIQFFVPKTKNRLFLFGADGTRRDFPLSSGEAKRIGALMATDPPPPDFVRLLERTYAEQHSPDCTGDVREALAALKER